MKIIVTGRRFRVLQENLFFVQHEDRFLVQDKGHLLVQGANFPRRTRQATFSVSVDKW